MKILKKYCTFIVAAIISLLLGYKTQQILSPPASEIIIEMEALPAPSASPSSPPATIGQAIYESHCAACHNNGAANAPKLGDLAAWKSRNIKNTTLVLQHVIQGYNLMPPKGACLECSDTDLNLAIEYMIKKSS